MERDYYGEQSPKTFVNPPAHDTIPNFQNGNNDGIFSLKAKSKFCALHRWFNRNFLTTSYQVKNKMRKYTSAQSKPYIWLERVELICISSERDTLFDLDDRIKSRLNATQVEFKAYTASDLFQILKLRAEMALLPKTWDKGLLKKISVFANGDARVAIQTLKNAAYYAERSGAKRIFQERLDRGWKDARAIKRTYLLNKLTEDYRILFEIVRQKKEIISGDLWAAYLSGAAERGLNPIALRTFSEYMNKLRDVGLVKVSRAGVRGKVRLFKVAE